MHNYFCYPSSWIACWGGFWGGVGDWGGFGLSDPDNIRLQEARSIDQIQFS